MKDCPSVCLVLVGEDIILPPDCDFLFLFAVSEGFSKVIFSSSSRKVFERGRGGGGCRMKAGLKSGVLRVIFCFCKSPVTVGTQGGYY